MLSKCANPACDAKFQYLHLGKVFAIEYRNSTRGYAWTGSSEFVQKSDHLRYFWLCSACSQSMTIQVSGAGGVRIAPTESADDPNQSQARESRGQTEELRSDTNQVWEYNMLNAKHTLNALVKELEFLEGGGYRQPMGWRPVLIFEDSPICPKYPFATCPDAHCVLLDFVPEGQLDQTIPCQHIPLNETGETLHSMYDTATMDEIENVLREWLRKRIAEIKQAADSRAIPCNEDAA